MKSIVKVWYPNAIVAAVQDNIASLVSSLLFLAPQMHKGTFEAKRTVDNICKERVLDETINPINKKLSLLF